MNSLAGAPYMHLTQVPAQVSKKIQKLQNFKVSWIHDQILLLYKARIIPAYMEAKKIIAANMEEFQNLLLDFETEHERLIALDADIVYQYEDKTKPNYIQPTTWMLRFPDWNKNIPGRINKLNLWIEQIKKHMSMPDPLSEESVSKNIIDFFACPPPDITKSRQFEIFSIIDYKHNLCNQLKWIVKNSIHKPIVNPKHTVVPSQLTIDIMNNISNYMQQEGRLAKEVSPFEWTNIALKEISFCIMSVDEHSIAHGSFIAGLLNPDCKYGDVDFYSPVGGLLLASLSVIGTLVGLGDFVILVVPYIKNYITLKDEYQLSVFDCCVYTKEFLQSIPTQQIDNFKTVDSAITLINMFRSAAVQDRRVKTYSKLDRTIFNAQVLLEHTIKTKHLVIDKVLRNRNKLFKFFQKKVILKNSNIETEDCVTFDISSIANEHKTYIVNFRSKQKMIEQCKNIPGKYSRTFESILDENWFETDDKQIIASHASLEVESVNNKLTYRTLVSMMWSLCLYSFLHHREQTFKNLFVFCLGISAADVKWNADADILPREKNTGRHFGWSLKSKTFRGYVGQDIHPPSQEFVAKEYLYDSVHSKRKP